MMLLYIDNDYWGIFCYIYELLWETGVRCDVIFKFILFFKLIIFIMCEMIFDFYW